MGVAPASPALLTFKLARTWLPSAACGSQPKPPRDLTETIAVAMGHAARADERAPALVESIRASCPIEADVIEAIFAARQNRHEQAARFLARAFGAMRSDPNSCR